MLGSVTFARIREEILKRARKKNGKEENRIEGNGSSKACRVSRY